MARFWTSYLDKNTSRKLQTIPNRLLYSATSSNLDERKRSSGKKFSFYGAVELRENESSEGIFRARTPRDGNKIKAVAVKFLYLRFSPSETDKSQEK